MSLIMVRAVRVVCVSDSQRRGVEATLRQIGVEDAVRALKVEGGNDLHVIGSPGLVQTLMALGLLDELRLMIDPLVAGGGKRLFRDDLPKTGLRLVEAVPTPTGPPEAV